MNKPKSRDMIGVTLFLVLVLALWTGLSLLPGPALAHFPFVSRGSHDLTRADFTNTIYRLAQAWETWPERLYTSDELRDAEDPIPYDCSRPYATHRVTLKLTPGITYGFSNRSSDYAMRLFLNGEEIITSGNPGATEEENVPEVREFVHYFTPQTDTVELVLQSSNYVHYRDGTKAPALLIGTAENVAAYVHNNNLRSGIIFGCLMVAFLYHFAIFLLNWRQRASLVFGLLCLLVGLYSMERFITLTMTVYRLGYTAMILSLAGLVLLVDILFPSALNKWVVRAFYAVCGVYLAVSQLAHPMFVTRVLAGFQAISIAMIAYLLICLALTLREKKLKNILAFLGIGLFGLSAAYDMLYKNGLGPNLFINNQRVVDTSSGMVLLVACYALVLAVNQAEVNLQLEAAEAALAEGEAPPTKLSNFGLSKRETEVALLLLDGKTRAEISGLLCISAGTVNTHCTKIYRKTACGSVAELASLIWFNGEMNEKHKTNVK